MLGRMYSAGFDNVGVTAVQDLFEVNAPADAVVIIHRVVITQYTDTDSEQLRIAILRSTGASGSGGSASTPSPLQVGSPAFGGTVEVNNTSIATTLTTVIPECANILNGWDHHPTPEERIVISPSGRLVVSLLTAPADSLTMCGYIVFEELGG